MALSLVEKKRAPSAQAHNTVEANVADDCLSAAPVRDEVKPVENDVAEVDVEAQAVSDETIRKNEAYIFSSLVVLTTPFSLSFKIWSKGRKFPHFFADCKYCVHDIA